MQSTVGVPQCYNSKHVAPAQRASQPLFPTLEAIIDVRLGGEIVGLHGVLESTLWVAVLYILRCKNPLLWQIIRPTHSHSIVLDLTRPDPHVIGPASIKRFTLPTIGPSPQTNDCYCLISNTLPKARSTLTAARITRCSAHFSHSTPEIKVIRSCFEQPPKQISPRLDVSGQQAYVTP